MVWTDITRPQYRRKGLRYSSDTTDEEWRLISTHLPPPRRLGWPWMTDLRAVVNALFYIASSGCQWRLLPDSYPPYTTVQRFFYAWRDDGIWQRVNHELVMLSREASGREASPSAGVIGGQSVKTTRRAGHAASMPARRSRVASAISSPILPDTSSGSMSTRPIVRIGMGRWPFWPRSGRCIPGCATCSQTALMPATSWRLRSPDWDRGPSRSSNGRIPPGASSCCPGAGTSSAPSPGSDDAEGSPRTSRLPSPAPRPGSGSPTSGSSPNASPDFPPLETLHQWLNIPIASRRRQEEEPAFDLLFGEMWEGGERDLWNLLDPSIKRWTPFNDHLLQLFQIWFASEFFDDADIELTFEWLELLVGILTTVQRAEKDHLALVLGRRDGERNFLGSAIGRVAWHSENQERLLNRMTRDPTASQLLSAGFAAGDREFLDLLDRNFRSVIAYQHWR